MHQNLIKIDTSNMTRAEWEAARMKTIGGSDAGAIVGMDEYKSPYTLWLEKTGRVIPEEISQKEAVRIGNDLEGYVAQRFSEKTGLEVYKPTDMLINPKYPWAHANIDGFFVGEDAGAEYKTKENRDRVWQMLRNTISSGSHYFKFPTDAEVEGEEE